MANNFLPKSAPIWGWPMCMSTADLLPSYQADAVSVLSAVAAPASSAAIKLGARGVQLILSTSVAGATCDVALYQVINSVNVLVKQWFGASSGNLFAGNLEHVDMQGNPIVVSVANISSGNVSVGAKVMY